MVLGRPPVEKSFTNMLRIAAAEAFDEKEGVKRTKLRALADMLIQKGIEGDVMAAREVADRIEGKPAQAVQLSGDPDNPVQVIERRVVDTNG